MRECFFWFITSLLPSVKLAPADGGWWNENLFVLWWCSRLVRFGIPMSRMALADSCLILDIWGIYPNSHAPSRNSWTFSPAWCRSRGRWAGSFRIYQLLLTRAREVKPSWSSLDSRSMWDRAIERWQEWWRMIWRSWFPYSKCRTELVLISADGLERSIEALCYYLIY